MLIQGVAIAPTRSAVLVLLCVSTFCWFGCNQSTGPVPQQVAPSAQAKQPDWNPAPLPFPEPPPFKRVDDEDMHAMAGVTWPGVESVPVLLRFNVAGDLAVAALADGTCHFLDPKTAESRHKWESARPSQIVALEITMDNQRVVMQHANDGAIYVRDLVTGDILQTIKHSTDAIVAFALGTDPRLVVVGTARGQLQIYDLVTGTLLREAHLPGGDARVTALAVSVDYQKLFAACEGSTSISVFQLPQLAFVATIEQPCGTPVKMTPAWGGHFLMVQCADGVGNLIRIKELPSSDAQVYARYGAVKFCHGAGDNWFPLPSNNRFCCYLGGQAFEYYDPFDGAVAGNESVEQSPRPVVALSSDGTLAATGSDDGSIGFFALPGPGKSAFFREQEFGNRIRDLLLTEQYDELEQIAEKALAETKPDTTMCPPVDVLRNYLTILSSQQTVEAWTAHLAALEKWRAAKPDSRAARYALGVSLKNYAWHLRGQGYANQTSDEAFQGFFEQLSKADAMLERADEGVPSAPICAEWITVGMGLQKGSGELLRLWERGVQAAPGYPQLHQNIAYALLPKWGGNFGEVSQLANRALKELAGDDGHLAYATMGVAMAQNEYPFLLPAFGFDLAKLDEATQAVLRLCPESEYMLNLSTIVACLRVDHAATAERISRAAGRHDRAMWRSKRIFDKFRTWAQAKHVSTDAPVAFLATWNSLRQIAFADDGDRLMTLADDPMSQVHIWEIDNLKGQGFLPLVDLQPWFMSRDTRWIVGQTGTPPQVAIFDSGSGQAVVFDQIDPYRMLCIAVDRRQIAAYGRGNRIDVYALDGTDRAPVHSVAVDQMPVAVEFLSKHEPWSIVGADIKANLRLFAEDGRDLVPPITLPRVAERLLAIPGGSHVLAAGDGMLVVADMASGKTKALSAEPSTEQSRTRYSALAVNRTGQLAAAACIDLQNADRPYRIELWDLDQARNVAIFAGHDAQIGSMSFSPDGQRLASGDTLGFVQVWNLESINHGK